MRQRITISLYSDKIKRAAAREINIYSYTVMDDLEDLQKLDEMGLRLVSIVVW